MKSEEKIIELLAEYLKKADQLLDRMDRTERGIDIMSKAIAEHSVKFNKVFDEIKQLREDQNRLSEDQNKLREEHNRMREEQGIMLKELVSISKRVAVVEEKH
jgi:chromosome segregation ATPase